MLVPFVKAAESLVDIASSLWPAPVPDAATLRNAKIVGHRGDPRAANAIENTLPAFAACDRANVWGIELDVHWTADNEPVISHDPTLRRCFAKPLEIESCTLESLKRIEPRVPALADVVMEFGRRRHLMIELKQPLSSARRNRLREVLRELEPAADFHLLSLTPKLFAADLGFPEQALMLVAETNIRFISDAAGRLNLGAIGGHYLLLGRRVQAFHQSRGRQVGVGFVDGKMQLYRSLNRRVDWVFSNRAVAMQSTLDAALAPR